MASLAEIDMMDSLRLLNRQFAELNKKFDKLLEIKRIVPGIPIEPVLNCRHPDHIWSIEFSGDYVLIKYRYDSDFQKFLKNNSIKLYWDKNLLGILTNKEHHEQIYSQICKHFPEWECIDKRT